MNNFHKGWNKFRQLAGCRLFVLLLILALLPLNQVYASNVVPAGILSTARETHSATLLSDGRVLVVGGFSSISDTYLSSAEIYDPVADQWSPAGNLATPRALHAASLLPNGKVIVVGGANATTMTVPSAELYDPNTNSWSLASAPTTAREQPTATLLPSGKVLVAGGANAELYDPSSNTWSAAGNLNNPRSGHFAVLLPNGKVLITGGDVMSAETYDPASNSWTTIGNFGGTYGEYKGLLLSDGTVFMMDASYNSSPSYVTIYNPNSNSASQNEYYPTNRNGFTVTLLPNGKVLALGGASSPLPSVNPALFSAEMYDPATESWSVMPPLAINRVGHTATLLNNGKVLVVGGSGSDGSTELYDVSETSWSQTASLVTDRTNHTATLLTNGKTIVVGGWEENSSGNTCLSSAELFDPNTNTWSSAGNLFAPRGNHTATLLPNGRLFIVGGYTQSGFSATAELYDPGSNTWLSESNPPEARVDHTATLLLNGNVLITGGETSGAGGPLATCRIYNPSTNIWSSAGSLISARAEHIATLLSNGSVLVTGGVGTGGDLTTAELYNPSTDTWSSAGNTISGIETAALLSNGKVLVTDGFSVELYDSSSNSWSTASNPAITSSGSSIGGFSATPLADGKLLVAGGYDLSRGYLTSSSIYDPDSDRWIPAGNLIAGRSLYTTTLQPNGKILLVGGNGLYGSLSSAELFDQTALEVPTIATTPITLEFGNTPLSETSTAKTVTIFNTGLLNLSLLGFSVNGPDAGQFALVPGGTCNSLLIPGASCQENVTITPTSFGGKNASLQIQSNDPVSSVRNIPLSGIPSYTVNVTFAGTGTGMNYVDFSPSYQPLICYENCSEYFDNGTVVTVFQSADVGAYFAGWTGCDSVNGTNCIVTMNSDKSVTASFYQLLAITTTSLSAGTTGSAYSKTVATTGGKAPNTWIIISGSLPAGLTINSSTGAITGTPTTTGTSTFTVQVSDANNTTASSSFSIVINPGTLSVTTSTLAAGYISNAYSQSLAGKGGSMPFTWSITSGSLPSGLSLNAGSGTITGSPTTSGTSTFTVQVTDAAARIATKSLSIIVYAVPMISTTSLPTATTGTSYSSTLSVTGGKSSYSWSIISGALPAGLSLNASSGAITGTPTSAGNYSFTVQVKDANGMTATASLAIVVNPALGVSTTTLADGYISSSYSQTLAATGGATPYTWSITSGTLPTGLTLNASSGAITGTPTTAGTKTFTIQVKDANAKTATKSLSIAVYAVPAISTSSLASATTGTAYNQTLATTGGKSPYTWSISTGSLPAGLALNSGTGAITGTPTTTGTSSFTVQVSDMNTISATKALSIVTNAGTLTVTTASLPPDYVGSTNNQNLTASGGSVPFTWSITSGTLPAGLNLNTSSGYITGVPTASGTNSITFKVTDVALRTATKSISITVYPTLTIATASLPDGYVSSIYNQTLTGTGGSTPYTWSITGGSLPAGLALNASSGAITGTPTTAGTGSFSVQLKDANNAVTTQTIAIVVYMPPAINLSNPADGYIGSPYSQNLTTSGGKAPYSWSLTSGSLPAGLSLDPVAGTISGTPTTAGSTSFTVQAKDANSVTASATFTMAVYIAPSITTGNFADGYVGSTYSQSLTANGGKSPYTWTIVNGNLPAGLFLNSASGAINGTTSTAGSSSFTVQVKDANNVAITKSLAIVVYATPSISTATLADGYISSPYSQNLTTSGGKAPYNWLITGGSLPAGLSLDPVAGSISGTPTSAGSTSFTVQAKDTNNVTTSKTLTMVTYVSPAFATSSTADGYVGSFYSQALTPSGGKAPYSWSITGGNLPAGLSLDPTSGIISGIQAVAGNSNFTVQVKDANNVTATKALTLGVYAVISLNTSLLPDDFSGIPYNQTLAVSGGKPPLSWSIVTGSLPAGLTLATATGVISGSPSSVGSSSFTVQVSDANLVSATMSLSINVTPPPFTVVNLGDVGDVTIMQVVGNYDAKNADGSVNALPREMIAKEYFKNHSDTVDFLVFLSTFDYATPEVGAMAFYMGVKNDTQGINQPIFDNTALFGSQGILQGTIDLGNVTALAAAPYGTLLDQILKFQAHEMLHRFAAYVNYKNPDGTLNTSLLGKDNVHWSYLLDTQGSLLYGNGWTNNGNGTFTSTSVMSGYSPLDLYLMGLIPKTQVPPMLLINNPAIDSTQLPQLGATISGTATTVSIDDIIAAAGPRVPDSTTSKKTFNFVYVLLTRPGDDTNLAQPAIEILRSAWAGKYKTVTQGGGSIASVPATLNVYIDSSVSGSTVTGPDVTVTGAVVNSTGVETGVTVNGVLATVSGSRFVANHVPLQSGANTILVSATDINGLTASASCSVTDTPGYYLRIVPNVTSGTAPLNVSFSIDSSFIVSNPSMTTTGPAQLTLTAASPNQYTGTISFEGTYTVTVNAAGPDGQQYSDTVTFTVFSSSQLQTLMQAKWNGIKASIAASDVNGIVSYLPTYLQAEYTTALTALGSNLSVFNDYMTPLQFIGIVGGRAKFLTYRTEQIQGQPVQLAFPVYFIQENGIWKLSKF